MAIRTRAREAAGQRDRAITLEQLTETVGPSRFPIETWSPLATEWAARDDDGGSEAFAAHQTGATADVRWTIRYRADCDPERLDVAKVRRVVAEGRVYDILAANQIGRRQALELRTRAKVG